MANDGRLTRALRLAVFTLLMGGGFQGVVQADEGVVAYPAGVQQDALLPHQDLNARWVYQLLLAEIAAQRNHFSLATRTYLDLARTTRDPRVARRATEIALYGHDLNSAEMALGLWLKESPKSPEARETLAGLLMAQPHLSDATPLVLTLLKADKNGQGDDFLALAVILSQYPDRAEAWHFGQDVAKGYPQVPEAHYLLGMLAVDQGDTSRAMNEVHEALALRPDWGTAVALEAQLLQKQDSGQALELYQGFLEKHPDAEEVRLPYARYLIEQKRYADGRQQFQRLLDKHPDQSDLLLAVGLLDMQLNDFGAAETQFQTVLKHGYREPDRVRFYLGQAAEEQHHWDQAIQWYQAVVDGEQRPVAQIRIALIEAQQGKVQQALDLLSHVPAGSPERLEQRTMAQEQIQRDAGDYLGAWDTLTSALASMPNAADLLYERAIIADKLNRMDALEKDLRRVIALRPDYAHAYNALGYSLAEHNLRLDEAQTLIEKALSLSPNDPFIIDSLGWLQFRQGHLADSVITLKRAFAMDNDPEIASHLGEALWLSGDQKQARDIWETTLKAHPDNSVLLETVHRFLR